MAKGSRAKARRAKLQAAAAAPQQDADAAAETQAKPSAQPPSPELERAASSDEEHKESERHVTGELLRGHKFYLARTLSTVRRAELRELITQNGGVVVPTLESNTVELVDRAQIQTATDENWVAAEFVEDSIRDGELKRLVDYMAKTPLQQAMEDLRWTPSGRKPKTFYTAKDDATMLQYIHDEHPVYFGKPSVPERIWRIAQTQKLLGGRTFNSMHQRYRTRLVMLTETQRAALYEQAGMANPEIEKKSVAKPEQQEESQEDGEEEEQGEEAEKAEEVREEVREEAQEESTKLATPAKRKFDDRTESRTATPERTKTAEQDNAEEQTQKESDDENEIDGRSKKRRKKSSSGGLKEEALEAIAKEKADQTTTEEGLPIKTSSSPTALTRESAAPETEQTADGNEDETEQSETVRSGEIFRGYWKRVVSDPLERPHIERFFTPPSPTAAEISQSRMINSASGVHRTPQRSQRLSNPGHSEEVPSKTPTTAMTPAQQRRARRTSTGSIGTPGLRTPGSRTPGSKTPVHTPQQDLLSQLEEMVGQRMTPPRRKSLDRLIPVSQASEDDANELIKRLQFETAQDSSSVCSALYWASGDASIARDFLLGQAPPEMWSPRDDQLLVDFMRLDVTEADIANARHRGAFEKMQTKRSARDILRRIQFLL